MDIFGVFLANAAFAAGNVVFEIPTGVLADTRGRRLSFLLSVAILLVGTLAYVGVSRLGGGLEAFIGVSLLLGLGFTFYSGAVEAWLVDALQDSGYQGQLDSVFARGSMVTGGAMLVGSIGGGLLGTLDLALPYLVRSVMLAAVFVVAYLWMEDLGFTPVGIGRRGFARAMREVARASVDNGWCVGSIRLLMMASFVQSGFLAWAFYAWQPYFLELLGREAVWVAGVVSALMAASMIAGNALVDWFSRFCGKRTTLLLWATAAQTLAAIGVGLVDSFAAAVTLFLVVTGAAGVISPVKQAYMHQVIPSEARASVISFVSLMGNAGGLFGQGGLGYLSRARSIPEGYVVGGIATLLALPPLILLRRMAERADIIVGRRAGRRGPCAGQGLPEVGLIDSTPRVARGS